MLVKVSKCLNTDVSPQHQLSLAVCLDALHVLLQLKPVTTITPTAMLNIVLTPTDREEANPMLRQVSANTSALPSSVSTPSASGGVANTTRSIGVRASWSDLQRTDNKRRDSSKAMGL